MRATWVHVESDFRLPPDRIFNHLAEHENLADVFGTKIVRVRDGDTERNGVGSVRRLGQSPIEFEETVTEFVPDELIEYRITKGSPLKGHVGIMRFSPAPGGGTHLDYRIRISSSVPFLGPIIRGALQQQITKAMAKLDQTA